MLGSHRASLMLITAVVMLLSGVLAAGVGPTTAFAAADVASCAPNSGSATIGGTITGAVATPLNGVQVTAGQERALDRLTRRDISGH